MDPHGGKGKDSQAHDGFYKHVTVFLPSPRAEHIYCEGNGTNNHVAFALSTCSLGSLKRQLNLFAPHSHRDRKDFSWRKKKKKITALFIYFSGSS